MSRSALAVCLVLVLSAAAGAPSRAADPSPTSSGVLARAAELLVGSYSSQEQSQADPEYRDIRLQIVPIWTARTDGPWLYVEQAVASSMDKPYRQRVYHLVAIDDHAVDSQVWTLPGDPLQFAGAYRQTDKLTQLTPADLKQLQGCTVHLRLDAAQELRGGTEGKGCASTREGAAYTTSEVHLTASALLSWDRGFGADDKQVWGAQKGGYVFKRLAR